MAYPVTNHLSIALSNARFTAVHNGPCCDACIVGAYNRDDRVIVALYGTYQCAEKSGERGVEMLE